MKQPESTKRVRNADTNFNTNLASEYLIMSLLSRAGKDAYLSLGNKKGVDIIVKTENGAICILEVKGTNKDSDPWPVSNSGVFPHSNDLFYALVCFNSKINEITEPAEFWVIPSMLIFNDGAFSTSKNNRTVYLLKSKIREKYKDYRNTIQYLDSYLAKH
jgi:hypothetical protein